MIFAEAEVSTPARLLRSALATYPAVARAENVEATVLLQIVVDTAGSVTDARVVQPAGYGFDQAAEQAIRGYKFKPASRRNHAVRVRMTWAVSFQLR